MSNKFGDIAFTQPVKAVQEAMGSRSAYSRREAGPDVNDRLGPAEAAFVVARDGFYIATISETGWPYMQFRGGSPGFLRVLNERELGFADFRGNRQYITTGNLATSDRESLFLMDYANRRRLKIFGRMRVSEDPELGVRLAVPGYRATVERAFLVRIEAFDWNCPQHITPRFTKGEIAEAFSAVRGGTAAHCGPAFLAALED